MNLTSPISVQPPSISKNDGSIKTFNPITINELDYTIFDNVKRKICSVRITPCPYPLVLWKGDDYTAIGDYTTAQVESRILELLGDDISAGLQKLFIPPAPNRVS